jgi:hypothetical protein
MKSFFGRGVRTAARGTHGAVVTTGLIVTTAIAGAVGGVVLTAGATQVAANLTQPNQTAVNVNNVSQPNYAD